MKATVFAMNLPLAFSPIATTFSPEETEDLFREQLVSSQIMNATRGAAFGVEMNGAPIGDCFLSFIHHRSDYKIDCGEVNNDDSIIFGYGRGTPSSTSFSGRGVNLNDHGVIITKHSNLTHQRQGNSSEFVVNCPSTAIETRLQLSLDRHTSRQLVFDETVSMDTPIGGHAKATMTYIMSSLDSNPGLLNSPLVVSNYEELLLGVILSLPNNYTERLNSPGMPSVVPGLVSRAESFIEGNAHLPITMPDVLAHVGCSKSALFKNFNKFRGYTPFEFLTNQRLTLVRNRLLDASEGETVTSIANDLGFAHMGRFSMVYRKRYDEKPSDTLRRALD